MVFIFRAIVVLFLGVVICLFGTLFCLFNPRNSNNVARFAHIFAIFLTPLCGVRVITREYNGIDAIGNCIYIANHQNNYDVLVAANIVQKRTVTVGKKSLAFIPFFGSLYWLTGNILIDRENKSKALDTIGQVVREIKEKQISVWMFPEGTRSRGRGLLPFKTGAFRAAIAAGVPVVPICVSDTNSIKLNRWNNGYMIVEMLDPIPTEQLSKENARELMELCYKLMADKIASLNREVTELNQHAR